MGEWICGFSGSCEYANNLIVEVQAINQGLEIAWAKGIGRLFWTMTKCVLDLLNTTNNLHPLFPLLAHITNLMNRRWDV